MFQKTARIFALFVLSTLLMAQTLAGQAGAAKEKKPAASKMTDSQKIALAVSATIGVELNRLSKRSS